MPRLTQVTCEAGDWEAWYVDGHLIEQTHRVDSRRIVQAIPGVEFDSIEVTDTFMDELGGQFPGEELPEIPSGARTPS